MGHPILIKTRVRRKIFFVELANVGLLVSKQNLVKGRNGFDTLPMH